MVPWVGLLCVIVVFSDHAHFFLFVSHVVNCLCVMIITLNLVNFIAHSVN